MERTRRRRRCWGWIIYGSGLLFQPGWGCFTRERHACTTRRRRLPNTWWRGVCPWRYTDHRWAGLTELKTWCGRGEQQQEAQRDGFKKKLDGFRRTDRWSRWASRYGSLSVPSVWIWISNSEFFTIEIRLWILKAIEFLALNFFSSDFFQYEKVV